MVASARWMKKVAITRTMDAMQALPLDQISEGELHEAIAEYWERLSEAKVNGTHL